MSGTVEVKFLTPQEKLEKFFQELELAYKKLDRFCEKEMKGEYKRYFKNQLDSSVNYEELLHLKF